MKTRNRTPRPRATDVQPALQMNAASLRRLEKNAHKACDLLGAMANTSRLMILCQLAGGEKSVSELQPLIGLSQSALSQHLAVLRRRHVVRTRRDGQSIHYRLASAQAASLMETLHEQFCAR
jgi:ArsR family transcriptional regulator, virulence genes transcriptional regulator